MPSSVCPPPSSYSPDRFDDACALIQPLLSAYVDEQTTPVEAEQISAHLAAGCARCANEWAFLRLSRAAIARSTARVAVPAGLSERIARATYARPTLVEQVRALLRPAPVRATAGGLALAAGLAVVLMTRGSGGHDVTIRPVVASRGNQRAPVAAAPPRRMLPGGNSAGAGGNVPARIVITKNAAAAAPPTFAPPREESFTRPRPNVVLPRNEEGVRSVTPNPVLVAKHDKNGRVRPAAPLQRDESARVVAGPRAVTARRIIASVSPRDTDSSLTPAAPPVVTSTAPPLSPPPTRVPVAAAPASPDAAGANPAMMTASVSSGALKEEGGRFRIVQHRSSASLPAVEAEPVERVRSAETRGASAYQELGQGQGGSSLLVGSR